MDHSTPALTGTATLAALVLSALLFAGCGEATAPRSTATDQRIRSIDDEGERQPVLTRNIGTVSSEVSARDSSKKLAGEHRQSHLKFMADDILTSQWNEASGCDKTNPYYGGTARDRQSRPDLRSTALSLEVLRLAGVPDDSPQIQRAIAFVSRCQCPEDHTARQSHGGVRDVGGFALEPVHDILRHGDALTPTGRPSGAATSIGITSLLAAGIAPEDARIRGALKWLREHYSLDVHPGMARTNEGLYLYYYEFAKAMRALKLDHLRDSRGVVHDWRRELEQRLALRQEPNGSWVNQEEAPDTVTYGPVTTTSYALLTLSQIHKSREDGQRPRQRPSQVKNVAW